MALENFRKQMSAVEKSYDHEQKAIEVVTEAKALPDDLTRLAKLLVQPQLKYLILKNKFLGHNDVSYLIEGLGWCNLLKLDLTNNEILDRGIALVCDALSSRSSLTELVLEQTGFGNEGAFKLAELMRKNKSIQVLDVSQNIFTLTSLSKLVSAILVKNSADESSSLIHLDLSNTRQNNESTELWCAEIAKLLRGCGTLEELLLLKNDIDATGAEKIAEGLPSSSVTTLDLSDNPLRDAGVLALANQLNQNPSLRDLNLTEVEMGAEGFSGLCEMIRQSDTLVKLRVGDNAVPEGALVKPLLKMIFGDERSGGVSQLKLLDISGINLSEEEAVLLGSKLGEPMICGLKELKLAKCGISDTAVASIAKGLVTNMTLSHLDLTGNPFGPAGAQSLVFTLKKAKVLKELRVSGSRIEVSGVNYLCEALRYNKEVVIKGSASELDFIEEFLQNKGAFVFDKNGVMSDWSHAAWTAAKKGYGAIIGTVLYRLSKEEKKVFSSVVARNENMIRQTMFECLIRNGEAPVMDALRFFTSHCKFHLDEMTRSDAGIALGEKSSTYRIIAQEYAKDEAVKVWAKEHNLILHRYKRLFGGVTHENTEFVRYKATDMQAGSLSDSVFVQEYRNDEDLTREIEARDHMLSMVSAGGPFALQDSILELREVHESDNTISFRNNLESLSSAMDSLGACAGYDITKTVALAQNCAQILGLINSYGLVHGDFRPKNLMMVARERYGFRNGKSKYLPEKWVLSDFSKSVKHGEQVAVRADSAYMPPEVAQVVFSKKGGKKHLPKATEKMDVWAFGVVLYQLLTGLHLFHTDVPNDRLYRTDERAELMNWLCLDKDRESLILHRANEGVYFDEGSWMNLFDNAKDLVNWCLQGHYSNRPTFNEILQHPFLKFKRTIAYNTVDILLNWYEVTGRKKGLARALKDRVHAHVVNSGLETTMDASSQLQGLYVKEGGKITLDSTEIAMSKETARSKVNKASSLLVLVTEEAFTSPDVVQSLVWAMDCPDTTEIIFLDMSTAGTGAKEITLDHVKELYHDTSKSSKFRMLVESLLPAKEKLGLEHLVEKLDSKDDLIRFLQGTVLQKITECYEKMMPFRTTPFLAGAMVRELFNRSFMVSTDAIKPFNSRKVVRNVTSEKQTVKVVILHNQSSVNTGSIVSSALANPALNLRQKMMGINESTEVLVHNNSFENKPTFEEILAPHFTYDENKVLRANSPIVVLCLVTEGFMELFKDVLVPLVGAKGPVVAKLITYDNYVPSKDEIVNTGLELTAVGDLAAGKSLYPLLSKDKKFAYEHNACLDNILEKSRYHLSRKILGSDYDSYELPTTIC